MLYKCWNLVAKGSKQGDSASTVRVLKGSRVDEVAGLVKGGHKCFLASPRESYRARQEWCLRLRCSSWAPHRWAHEMLCCPPSRGWRVEGERRGHTNHQSCRVEQGPAAPRWVRQTGGTWGQGHIKGIECHPSAWEGGDGVKRKKLRG